MIKIFLSPVINYVAFTFCVFAVLFVQALKWHHQTVSHFFLCCFLPAAALASAFLPLLPVNTLP